MGKYHLKSHELKTMKDLAYRTKVIIINLDTQKNRLKSNNFKLKIA